MDWKRSCYQISSSLYSKYCLMSHCMICASFKICCSSFVNCVCSLRSTARFDVFLLVPSQVRKRKENNHSRFFSNIALEGLKPNEKTSNISLNSNDKKIRAILMLEIRAHRGNYVTAFQSLNHNQHDVTGK